MRVMPLVAVLTLIVGAFCALPAAAAVDDILAKFTLDRFPETERAVGELAGSGHPQALAILDALGSNRLAWRLEDHSVIYKDANDAWHSALTGEVVADPGATKTVRINNGIRRALEAAIGGLTLLAPNAADRLAAAESVFKSRDPAMLPLLKQSLAKESDQRVARAFREAQAAITFLASDASEVERMAAAETLGARGDDDALAVLNSLASDAPARVQQAAAQAVKAVQNRLMVIEGVQNVFYGVSLGSVLLLAAIGLAITFGVMGIINMAHGEMVMIGAYTTFVVQEVIRTNAPSLFDASLAIAIPLAFLVAGIVGIIIERSVIRWLYGRPLETLLATWGVSLILQQAVRSAFGPTNREVGNPSFMSGAFDVSGVALTANRVWIIGFAASVFFALLFVLKYTSFGLRMRAVVQNRRMAASMGIRTNWIDALTFGLGSGIAGIAGVALSQIDNVSPNLGQAYIIDSFMVVVFGGVGSLWGTLVAGLGLGIANKFLEPFAGAVLGKILVLVFIILFIQKRPRGLFALKGRAVEQ